MTAAPLLVFPDPPPVGLTALLAGAGEPWLAVGSVEEAERCEPDEGWAGAIVSAEDPDAALALCRALRKRDPAVAPLILLVPAERLGTLELREDLFDDFAVVASGALAAAAPELAARLAHQRWRSGREGRPELVEYGELALNLETYQAAVAGRPLDLTYMEYELLKFLATHPGKVFTRETLLSRVWGYEYFGGARTVDVHVRRLRAKLGEEHAGLISTVRSVGYRFGQGRWSV